MRSMSDPMSTTSARPETTPTCAYPGCERPPRAAAFEGRGSKPKYCDLTDDQGRPAHTAMTAFRARAALDRAAGGPPSPADLDRPVTMATTRASELRTGMVADARGGLAREAQRRQQAEADAEEARAAASEMDEQLQAAEAAREQAEQRAADARAEADQARADAAARAGQAEADAAGRIS